MANAYPKMGLHLQTLLHHDEMAFFAQTKTMKRRKMYNFTKYNSE